MRIPALDLLFPPPSGRTGHDAWLSRAEQQEIAALSSWCEGPSVLHAVGCHSLDLLIAGGAYVACAPLRRAVHLLKYRRIQALADTVAGPMIRAALRHAGGQYVLCPVPLHWIRYFDRGFNQSALLAELLSSATGWPMVDLLRRTRSTGHQAERKRVERLTAMRNAFEPRGEAMPLRVLLVDDIATTLSTLDECAHALKQAGAGHVAAIVAARR